MGVHMIWAQTRAGVIGAGGSLPWHIPEELALFRRRTMSATVVMGRTTWESLPENARPLRKRRNIVLTRRSDLVTPGAEQLCSVEEVLMLYRDVWVIGGASVYKAFLPHAAHIVRTVIDLDVAGVAHAPQLGEEWRVFGEPESYTSMTGVAFTVEDLIR